jgi:hypothetical protein
LITTKILLASSYVSAFPETRIYTNKNVKLRHKIVTECNLLENQIYHFISIYLLEWKKPECYMNWSTKDSYSKMVVCVGPRPLVFK